jgi:hypothetical protein
MRTSYSPLAAIIRWRQCQRQELDFDAELLTSTAVE